MTTGTTGATGTDPGPLPPPPANAGNKWRQAYAAYLANPTAGYAAYYNLLAQGTQGAALLKAGNWPAPAGTGAGTGATGAAAAPSNVPLHNNDPNVLGLYNRDPNWLSNFTTPGTAFGGAPAATQGTGTPAPTGTTGASGPPGQTPGTGSGSGTGQGGNEGGASHGTGGGGAGDNAGHPGTNADGSAATRMASNGLLDDNSLLNIGGPGASALSLASLLAPGWAGMALGGAQLAGRGINTALVDQIRQQQGLPPLGAGQIAGSLTGANQYGNLGGGNTIADPATLGSRLGSIPAYQLADRLFGQFGAPAETQGGAQYQDGPGGILGWAARQLGLVDTSRALDIGSVNRLTNPNYSDSAWPSMGGDPESDMPAAPRVDMNKPVYAGNGLPVTKDGSPNAIIGYRNSTGGISNSPSNGSMQSNGGAGNNAPSNLGGGTVSNPGGGTTASGSAGTGGLNNGFGGGGYAHGGWIARPVNRLVGGGIPGDPRQGDNVPIRATPGEFMVNKESAEELGPNLLHALNNPAIAQWLHGQLSHFGADRGGQPASTPAPTSRPSEPADPHFSDAFIAKIMHQRHAAKLEALLNAGWRKSWV